MRSSLARSSPSVSFAFGGIAHMLRFTTEYEGRKTSVAAAVKRGCAAQGWRFLEVVGRFATDALPGTYFSSPTSRKITASARTKGVAIKKVYVQRETLFLTVTMGRPTGKRGEDADFFVLVFSKAS
jgi:hypothetical protein